MEIITPNQRKILEEEEKNLLKTTTQYQDLTILITLEKLSEK